MDELSTGKRFVVVLQCVDFRPSPSSVGNGLVRFTTREHSPCVSGCIVLRKPAFYRNLEGGDDMDGAQAADLAPFVADRVRRSGTWSNPEDFTAAAKLAASQEPWILCTSINPSGASGAASLARRFSYKGPAAVVTTVGDHNAFARQLGIDVARSVAAGDAVKGHSLDSFERHAYWAACGADNDIDAVVQVVHGPVHYRDSRLTVRRGEDIASVEPYRTWFTKGTKFFPEQEYRFAVLAGSPATDTFRVAFSSELSRLTASWRLADKWWSD